MRAVFPAVSRLSGSQFVDTSPIRAFVFAALPLA